MSDPRDNYVGIDNELEWRRDQMARNWPKNQYGSALTQGEWDGLLAECARLWEQRDVLLKQIRDEDAEAETWEDHAQQWRKQYLETQQEVARLREAMEELLVAISRQLALTGKGIEPSERLSEAISGARGALAGAPTPHREGE